MELNKKIDRNFVKMVSINHENSYDLYWYNTMMGLQKQNIDTLQSINDTLKKQVDVLEFLLKHEKQEVKLQEQLIKLQKQEIKNLKKPPRLIIVGSLLIFLALSSLVIWF